MPYSQTHLAAACDLLEADALRSAHPWLQGEAERAAFLLGAIGPDARVVSGTPREDTHYYTIPRTDSRPIEDVLLEACPGLRKPDEMTRSHAAFVAGYIAHLVMDVVWLEEIVMPCLFIPGEPWQPGHPNWVLYNVLMAHLEVRGSLNLCEEVSTLLGTAKPDAWIPCITDAALEDWGRHIARITLESGPEHVVTLLARSASMKLARFQEIVHSPASVAALAHPTVSRSQLNSFHQRVEQRSIAAVLDYLSTIKSEEVA